MVSEGKEISRKVVPGCEIKQREKDLRWKCFLMVGSCKRKLQKNNN